MNKSGIPRKSLGEKRSDRGKKGRDAGKKAEVVWDKKTVIVHWAQAVREPLMLRETDFIYE